jgi:hypothetical protein
MVVHDPVVGGTGLGMTAQARVGENAHLIAWERQEPRACAVAQSFDLDRNAGAPEPLDHRHALTKRAAVVGKDLDKRGGLIDHAPSIAQPRAGGAAQ